MQLDKTSLFKIMILGLRDSEVPKVFVYFLMFMESRETFFFLRFGLDLILKHILVGLLKEFSDQVKKTKQSYWDIVLIN